MKTAAGKRRIQLLTNSSPETSEERIVLTQCLSQAKPRKIIFSSSEDEIHDAKKAKLANSTLLEVDNIRSKISKKQNILVKGQADQSFQENIMSPPLVTNTLSSDTNDSKDKKHSFICEKVDICMSQTDETSPNEINPKEMFQSFTNSKHKELSEKISPEAKNKAREERLKKQKEKQEKFRQRFLRAQSEKVDSSPVVVDVYDGHTLASGQTERTNGLGSSADSSSFSSVVSPAKRSSISPTKLTTKFTRMKKRDEKEASSLHVLVDSKEISGAQDVINALRLEHKLRVTTLSLSACDYILSNDMAVDRITLSFFANSSNKKKMSQRLRCMQQLYSHCVLIVETDRVKPGQEVKRQTHRTKYFDTTLSYLAQTKVKIFYTENAEHTASLMAHLCQIEAKKGRALSITTALNPNKSHILNFYQTIPKLTVPQAVNLVQGFESIADFIQSPARVIKIKGKMTSSQAEHVYRFIHHKTSKHNRP